MLRSGECNSYTEVMERITSELKAGSGDGKSISVNGGARDREDINGDTASSGKRLKVPNRVIEEGVKVVRGAVEGCVEVAGEE